MPNTSVPFLLSLVIVVLGVWLLVAADGYVSETFTIIVGIFTLIVGAISLARSR